MWDEECIHYHVGVRGQWDAATYSTDSYVTWLIHMLRDSFIRGMTESYVWYAPFMCDMTHSYVTWLIHMWHDWVMCDMTESYVTWLSHTWHDWVMCDMTKSCVTWLSPVWHDWVMCDMTESCVTWLSHTWHDWVVCDMTESYVTWLIHMWYNSFMFKITQVYHICIWHDNIECVTDFFFLDCDWFICDMTRSCLTSLWYITHSCDMIIWSVPAAGYSHICYWFIFDMTDSYVTWLVRVWHHSGISHIYMTW